MPSIPLDIVGKNGWIAGWGKITQEHGHTGTNILRTASVPIICKYDVLANWFNLIVQLTLQLKMNASSGTRRKIFMSSCLMK